MRRPTIAVSFGAVLALTLAAVAGAGALTLREPRRPAIEELRDL
jgi:hypothetical protein